MDLKMSQKEMEELIALTFERVMELRRTKGAEYNDDDNCFSDFNAVSRETGLTQEMILKVFAGKHWNSISLHVRDLESGKSRKRTESIEQRIDDAIVYLCLLKGMVKARSKCPSTAA